MVDSIVEGWYEEIGCVYMENWPHETDEESLKEINATLPNELCWVPWYDTEPRMKLMEYKTN